MEELGYSGESTLVNAERVLACFMPHEKFVKVDRPKATLGLYTYKQWKSGGGERLQNALRNSDRRVSDTVASFPQNISPSLPPLSPPPM